MQPSFKDIINVESWQVIQNHFSTILRVNLSIIDKQGNLLSSPSIAAPTYDEIMNSSPEAISYAKICLFESLKRDEAVWKEGCQSPIGLHRFFIPIKIKELTIAYINVGPIVIGKYTPTQESSQELNGLAINSDSFLDALREVRMFSFYGIKSVVELLHDISTCICELSYQNARFKDFLSESPQASKKQSSLKEKLNNFYVDRLLKSFLEVCYKFTDADRASIMLVDKDKDELYIKMAKGLKEEIVGKTRVRIGQGLSGIVVQDKKPLFINDQGSDQRIRQHCNNPALKQSILIPLKQKEEVLGVLSLAVYKDDRGNFNSQNLETIDKLTELAESTLSAFSQSSL